MPAFLLVAQTPMACGFAQLARVKDSGPFPTAKHTQCRCS
jgi:hypothetical protein